MNTGAVPEIMPAASRPHRAGLYARVSTTDQHVQTQVDALRDLAERWGWTVVSQYVDKGISGTKDRRPQLDRMLRDAKKGEFTILVVWKSDRLFRSLRHMVLTLDELGAMGIEFVSATEPMDTTTPQGKLLLHLAAAFAEFERGVLIERTRAGLAAARRRGVRLGRPQVPVDLVRARALRAGGASLREIAKTLGVGLGTVHRHLRDHGAVPETPSAVSP